MRGPSHLLACLLWVVTLCSCLVSGYSHGLRHDRRSTGPLASASSADIDAARKIVKDAIAKAAVLNKARIEQPAGNTYKLAPGTIVGNSKVQKRGDDQPNGTAAPLLQITPEIQDAAALVAEADAAQGNWTAPVVGRSDPYWMETISRMGTSPWGNNPSYKVFRNVKDYGAKGDGSTDDTKAIWKAMSDGNRCGVACNGDSTTNAIVYFPAGTYLVSTNITVLFGTQVVGDANYWPTIKAAPSFVGLGVLSTDVYVGDGAGADGKDDEWYINTASFYRQIRNIRIDVTATDPNAYVCALHYQVAQATSLQNIELIATSGTTQQGIYAENGSGGFMSDVTFTGGAFGFYGGSQQFTVSRLTFNGCDTAIQIIWDWAWVWKSISISNSKVGFMLNPNGGTGVIGSVTIMDSVFNNVKQPVVMGPPSKQTNTGTTGIVLDNVQVESATGVVTDWNGQMYLDGTGGVSIDRWVLGPTYIGAINRTWVGGNVAPVIKDTLLTNTANPPLYLKSAPYFERAKPQYETAAAPDILHLKNLGAMGDGVTDDTEALNIAFSSYTGSIIYADAGVYIITDTVHIPPGTVIVGEAWTQFAAYGPNFNDQTNPHVMLQVGKPGDVGSVELQDIIVTTKGPTPGAVLVEWNIQADVQGAAAAWDFHARLGGATGTSLTPAECPALTDGTVKSNCFTANLVMHLTPGSSAYLENVWLWTADHMIDDPDRTSGKNPMTQVSVFTARGLLIESTNPTWLYGVASEHAALYQFNFYEAEHLYGGLLQTESPYYQPSPKAPAPFTNNLGQYNSDPAFDCTQKYGGCDSSWSINMYGSANIHLSAIGAYSWFTDYTQECVNPHSCQTALINLLSNQDNVRLEQIVTIGATTSLVIDGFGILAMDNLAVSNNNASWSQITSIDVISDITGNNDDDGDDVDGDGFTLDPPCDFTLSYATLADVQNDIPNVGSYCGGIYSIGVMIDMLDDALSEYENTTNGYAGKFKTYQSYIQSLVPDQIDACLHMPDPINKTVGPCNKYFSCSLKANGPWSPCPLANHFPGDQNSWDIYYRLNDQNGFNTELANDFGIESDWIEIPTEPHMFFTLCANLEDPDCVAPTERAWNYPQPKASYSIPNPQDVFTNVSGNMETLYWDMSQTYLSMIGGGWNGTVADAASVYMLPVTMATTAANAMNQVIVIAGEVDKAKKTNLILEIIGAVLLVLPLAGEVLGALGGVLATVGRIATLAGDLGQVAEGVYEIVEDPSSAPMAVFGIVLTGAGRLGSAFGKGSKDIEDAAGDLAKADGNVLKQLSQDLADNEATIGKIIPACKH